MSEMYVDSGVAWLGQVPTHWLVLEPRRIFQLRKQTEKSEDVHLTPSQHFGVLPQSEYMELTGSRVVLNLTGTKMQHVEPGDFISHLRTFQGGLELSRVPGKVSPAYTVISPRENADPEYFKYVFKSEGYISQIASLTDQLRDGQTMRFAEFNKTLLGLPPLREQHLIADFLDHETAEIDAFIADVQKVRHLTKERMAAFIDRELSPPGESTIALRRLKPVQVSGVSVNGASWPATLGEYGVLKTGAISKGWFDPTENKAVVDPHEFKRLRTAVCEDRVLVNRANTPDLVGSAVYVSSSHPELYLSDKMWSLDFDANNAFVAMLLSTRYYREQVRQRAVGASSSMQNLSYTDFLKIDVYIPDSKIQADLVKKISTQSRLEFQLLDQLTLAETLARERRAALISAAVTGQIDVTQKRKPVAEVLEEEAGVRV